MSSRSPIRGLRRHSSQLALALALIAAVLAFTANDLIDQIGELGDRADRRTDLDALVDEAGGATAVRECAPARTNQPMKAMLAWRIDVSMEHLADRPEPPAAVFSAPPGYAGEPAEPPVAADFEPPVATQGDWTLAEICVLTQQAAARRSP